MRALGASLSGADVWGVAKLMNHLVLISLNVRINYWRRQCAGPGWCGATVGGHAVNTTLSSVRTHIWSPVVLSRVTWQMGTRSHHSEVETVSGHYERW